jgi:hypothetical protein
MSVNATIVSSVKAYVGRGGGIGTFSADVLDALREATEKFLLAPDEFVDVGRLPASVTNLSTLFQYLTSIQQKLSTRDNKVKNEDWEVAKSGELRLYKLYVCAIHALYAFINAGYDSNANASIFAEALVTFARSNTPPGLAENGATLWKKAFEGSQPRTLAVVKSLLYFCMRSAGSPSPSTGGGPTGTALTLAGQDASSPPKPALPPAPSASGPADVSVV